MQDDQQQQQSQPTADYVSLSAEIISAYVANNSVSMNDIPALIGNVHQALRTIGEGSTKQAEPEKREPAVNPKKSVTPDFIISLFDGKKYKSLKRHIRTAHDMTPQQYREYWGLSHDYPMVAPNYAKQRSELAKALGLGQLRKSAGGKGAKKASTKSSKKASKKVAA
jgi:predicted transcriptional regulator